MSTTLAAQTLDPQQPKSLLSPLVGIIKRLEYGFAVVALFLYASDMTQLLISGGASEGDGVDMLAFDYSLSRQLYLVVYFITFVLAILRWKKIIYTLWKNKFILALLLLVPLSTLWSVNPGATVSSSFSMLSSALLGVYLASRYTLREQLQILGITYGLICLISLIFVLFFPHFGIMAAVHEGAWRGNFSHKNGFGQALVFAAAVFLVLANTKKLRWLYWFGFAATIVMIIFCNSGAALLNFVLATLLMLGSRLICLSKRRFILVFIGLLLICASLSVWLPELFATTLGAIGKDTTLTGRTDIWPYIIDKIVERPWLGYGYGTFWNGLNGESADIIRAVRWSVPNAHNGFLDLWLSLGFIGLFIYVAALWEMFFKAALLTRITHSWEQSWVLVFLILSIVGNFSETLLMSRNSVYSIVFFAIGFSESIMFDRLLNYRRQARLIQK